MNLRTTAIGLTDHPVFPPVRDAGRRLEEAVIAQRTDDPGGRSATAVVYERERLPVDAMFEGPAVVEEDGATTVVPPGWQGRRDAHGNLRLSAMPVTTGGVAHAPERDSRKARPRRERDGDDALHRRAR